jgi:SPFH domain / Band 7 family
MDNWNDENNPTGQFASARSVLESLKQPDRYVPVILAPLLFALLTILIILLLLDSHRTYISPIGFLPVVIVIVAAAVAQGMAVYYAGSENGLWILATAAGFCLFLLIDIFAIFGLVPALLMFFIFVALFVVLVRLYLRPVAEGYVDIVSSLGKYSRTLYSGPNILMPWEKVTHSLNVGEKQWVCGLQKVQLSRDEDVVLRATISYQLDPKDAHIAVTQVNQWEEMLKELVISTIQGIATTFTPDDFIAWPQGLHSRPLTYDQSGHEEQHWERVNDHLLMTIGTHAANWGVIVNWVRIRDVSLAPHGATIVETDEVFDMPTTIIEKSAPPTNPAPKPPAPKPSAPKASATKASGNQPKAPQEDTTSRNVHSNVHSAEDTTQAVPAPPAQDQPPPAPQPLNEKVLAEAYKAVQDGKITDPATIRSIAAKFEQVAQDPDARNTVSFDADRAAQILYGWAQKNDTLYNVDYEDETKPDWAVRRPNDENLMAGG